MVHSARACSPPLRCFTHHVRPARASGVPLAQLEAAQLQKGKIDNTRSGAAVQCKHPSSLPRTLGRAGELLQYPAICTGKRFGHGGPTSLRKKTRRSSLTKPGGTSLMGKCTLGCSVQKAVEVFSNNGQSLQHTVGKCDFQKGLRMSENVTNIESTAASNLYTLDLACMIVYVYPRP